MSHPRLTPAGGLSVFQARPPLFDTKRTRRHVGNDTPKKYEEIFRILGERHSLKIPLELNFTDSPFSSVF